MVKSLANRLSIFFVDKKVVDKNRKEWCSYVIEKKLVKIISFLTIFIVGCCFSTPLETIIFISSFCFVRKYANGYHANGFWVCLVLSSLALVISLNMIVIALQFSQALKIILSASCCFIITYPKNVDGKTDVALQKKEQINLCIVISISIILEIVGLNYISNILISSIIMTAITTYAKTIKDGKNNGNVKKRFFQKNT